MEFRIFIDSFLFSSHTTSASISLLFSPLVAQAAYVPVVRTT